MNKLLLPLALGCVLCLLTSGCASTDVKPEDDLNEPPPVDPRAAELFDKRCDDSMFQAAIARWRDNDVGGCQSLLERLLHRNPSYLEARLMLADLFLAQGNIPGAEGQLRWIVQQHPENPQARHSLGLLLDSTDRHAEALEHLREARRLDPQNQLYAMCEEAALGQITTGTIPAAASIGVRPPAPPASQPATAVKPASIASPSRR